MSLFQELRNQAETAIREAYKKREHTAEIVEIKINPDHFMELLESPEVMPQHRLDPYGNHFLMGLPIKRDKNIEKWKFVTRDEQLQELSSEES